ncbi:hypothetical protein OG897_06270 [Streptomyces sp. NBC_00237]|uniref:hypothetical protein n=1 Tax=Streptomyces sp. NBC_00237 TaxID=2975687 RepID=UPI00224EF827|nr:hypothetical protein [Streptomyces sp. NBC_00237]MCX5201067.1 hypothetical protein [Streptomyces sp. NBC_00237]
MNRFIWWAALAVIGTAAAAMTAWSLYVVAHDIYGVPTQLAVLTAAVFDGAAIACLYLANEAAKEVRSALGPHLATLALSGVSVYLNRLHAVHINGGLGATLLFAAPTVALLLVSGLAWSAVRARRRTAAGERPVTLPRYGVWGWLLAREEAWDATKKRAITHVTTSTDPIRNESGTRPDRPRTASAALRDHFTGMDPADAIRLAHSAKPGTPPAELAAELTSYGVHVSAVQVALVLGHQPPQVRIERPDPSGFTPDPLLTGRAVPPVTSTDPDPDRSGPAPTNVLEAVKLVAARGITDEVQATAEAARILGRPVRQDTVRKYLTTKAKPKPGSGRMEGGYN